MLNFCALVARFLRISLLSLATVLLGSCGGGGGNGGNSAQPRELSVDVNYYRNGCVGEAGQLCLQMRDSNNQLTNFYDPIDGFTYEWGYQYRLRIRETAINNPPQDGSSIDYTLLEQIDRQAETSRAEFKIWLPGADTLLTRKSANEYALPDGKLISCSSADCVTLDALSTQRFWVLMVLTLGTKPEDPLILKRIECSDTPASFIDNCL